MALGAGYHSVHALPLRLRQQVIGALNLFRADAGPLDELDVLAAQAFADAASIASLQQRALHDSQLLTHQLQAALASRIVIEQAKGMLDERAKLGISEAFEHIRAYARDHNQRLTQVSTRPRRPTSFYLDRSFCPGNRQRSPKRTTSPPRARLRRPSPLQPGLQTATKSPIVGEAVSSLRSPVT